MSESTLTPEQEKADRWNRTSCAGVVVDVTQTDDQVVRTRTRSWAEVRGGSAVVMVGRARIWYPLDRVVRVPTVSDEDFEYHRASGHCVCIACGKTFFDHPDDLDHPSYDGLPCLTKLCDGRIVKL